MKRAISFFLCLIMCFSVFGSAFQVAAVGPADKLFSVKSGAVKDGKVTYTVALSGGIEGFGGAVILINYDSSVLAPAEDGFRPAYTSSGVQQFKGIYVNGISAADQNVYSVAYTNTTPEAVKSNTDFFSITFDVIDETRPETSVGFYCREFFSTTDENQSITVEDGLQTIAKISKVVTIESPSSITAALKSGKIVVEWKESVGAVEYQLQRKTLDGAWGSDYTIVSADRLYYNDVLDLESGKTYMYRIRSVNEDGVTSVYTSLTASCRYIAKPSGIVAVNGVGGIDISWSACAGADSYQIMRRELGAEEWEVLTERSSALTTFYKDTSVENGKTYEYDVNATLGGFTTESLEEGQIVTYLPSPSVTSVTNIAEGVELKWDSVENASYYIVYRKAVGVETEISEYTTVVSNSFIDTDVQAGKAYTYSIKAVNDYGESAFTKTGYTITRVPATVVTNVVPEADYITVYFQKVDGVDGYNIYRKTDDTAWVKAGSVSKVSDSFQDKTVVGGDEYYYCAVPFIGNSESQKIASINSYYFLKTPHNVKAVNIKDGLQVTWDVSVGATEYYVYRRTVGNETLNLVASISAGEKLEYIDTDVENEEIYYYVVQAISNKGTSHYSKESPATMRITCVTGVGAERDTDGIYIKWRNHKFAESYIVCRGENGNWKRIGETAEVDFTDTTVESGKVYSYGIIPVVEEFEGGLAEDQIVEIKYIAAPTITGVTNYTATAKVEWTEIAGAEKYKLQRVTVDSKGNNSGSYKTIKTLSASETSYKDTDLVAGRTYRYRVFAIWGEDECATPASFKHTFLKVPEISSLSNAYGGIKISWSSVKNAEKYKIMRKESGGDWKTIKTVSSSNNSYTDKTTKNGVKYYYAVKAVKGDSLSYYESKSFKYFGSPKATVANKTSAITVTWDKISGAKSYYVYRKAPGETSWKRIAIVTKNIYTDSNVKNGKIYKYTVKAYNGDIFSGYNTSGWTIKRLSAPKLRTIKNDTSGITIKWEKSTGASKYIVMRKVSGSSKWEEIKTTTSLSFTDKTAKPGKIYTYTVKAAYGDYRSIYIADGLKIKRLEKPTLVSVKSSKSGVTFKWNEVTGASGYLVYRKTGSGEWEEIAKVTGASTNSYVDKTAKKGKTYYYSVRAYSGSYKSAYNTSGLKIKDKY